MTPQALRTDWSVTAFYSRQEFEEMACEERGMLQWHVVSHDASA
jgi:hypothetical protein